MRLRLFRAVSGLVPGDPLCSLSSVEFQIRALELLIECVDRDKLYAGIKGTQLWAHPNPNTNSNPNPNQVSRARSFGRSLARATCS